MKGTSKLVYVVTMYKFGDREKHSYVIGIYSKKALALKNAEAEREHRGGNKYIPEVLEFKLDGSFDSYTDNYKTILPLKEA